MVHRALLQAETDEAGEALFQAVVLEVHSALAEQLLSVRCTTQLMHPLLYLTPCCIWGCPQSDLPPRQNCAGPVEQCAGTLLPQHIGFGLQLKQFQLRGTIQHGRYAAFKANVAIRKSCLVQCYKLPSYGTGQHLAMQMRGSTAAGVFLVYCDGIESALPQHSCRPTRLVHGVI